MPKKPLSSMYRTMNPDDFPNGMEISFSDGELRQTMVYEKVTWKVGEETKGLRYGENPDQPAALYRLVNGNLTLGEVESIGPGRYLASDVELLQSGKHPGKINITDADSALSILRYFADTPCSVIVKHNNPSGVALGESLYESYDRALMADRVAAFGGCVAVNRALDKGTAEYIAESYSEVVTAPEFEEGVLDLLAKWKNLRIMRIGNIERLEQYVGQRVLDAKSLMDGGIIVQWSFVPKMLAAEDCKPAETTKDGRTFSISRPPTEAEIRDMIFGWLVESGVTSNSVIYVKDGVTVGIGTGEQDRVGVAEIARDKAYRRTSDRLAWRRYSTAWNELRDTEKRAEIESEVAATHGGLDGSVMISDAFFPMRDGVDVGLDEGVTAVLQPGGALRDHEIIEACNERGATMVFTGQRSFRH